MNRPGAGATTVAVAGASEASPEIDAALIASYDRYYATGYYHARYPAPNPRTVRALLALAPAKARVLDFGCGDGRYVPPLMARPDIFAVGYDVCPTALKLFSERFAAEIAAGRLAALGGGLEPLEQYAAAHGRFDLALMGFGVLGHIRGRLRRQHTLAAVRRVLAPGGRLLLGLPNARRRFHAEQRASRAEIAAGRLEPGDIAYSRAAPGGDGRETIPLYYHLYRGPDIAAELAGAGFRMVACTAESILPESAVVRSPLGAAVDGALMRVVPTRWGYGFLVTAEPAA